MARKGPLPRLLLINAPRVATDFKSLSPRSGGKSSRSSIVHGGGKLRSSTGIKDVSRGCKFGERRHRAVPSAFVVVCCSDLFARHLHGQLADLELGLPRRLVFLRHEATVAGHSKSAVDALSVPGAEQDLRGTIEERQRTVPRFLE
jgi:hypothetical protein